MQEIIRGIVVKIPNQGISKVYLLTVEYGKIQLVIFNEQQRARLRLGSLIECFLQQDTQGCFVATQTQLVAQPTPHHNDLSWFHHVLEIVYFFCPVGQRVADVYGVVEKSLLILPLHQHLEEDEWRMIQKGIIGCLLILFGFYPTASFEKTLVTICSLLAMTVDFYNPENLKLLTYSAAMLKQHDLAQYNAWLLASIKTHPRISGFKTLPFVYQTI
jgi:hypothetical protein